MGFYITTEKTGGFEVDFVYHGSHGSRIWMGFNIYRQARQQDLNGIQPCMTDKTGGLKKIIDSVEENTADNTVGFGWYFTSQQTRQTGKQALEHTY